MAPATPARGWRRCCRGSRASARVLLVDPQVYEEKNLGCQDIYAGDVGRPKALVQARRLRRINPAIKARAFCARVEDLPLGLLRVDAILSCVDSRAARLYINQAAWRLGVPWVDGAVDGAALLARVSVYVPGPEAVCAECQMDDEDYQAAALEQPYACQQGGAGPAATNAPASLGLVTAGIMALECRKLLAGERDTLLAGRQVMLDLRHHTHFVTTFHRRHCRFDHDAAWQIEPLDASPARLTLGQAACLGGGSATGGDCELRIEGQRFATAQFCRRCGRRSPLALRLAKRIPAARRRCAACGGVMSVRGFDSLEWVDTRSLGDRELGSAAVRPGGPAVRRTLRPRPRRRAALPLGPAGGAACGGPPEAPSDARKKR